MTSEETIVALIDELYDASVAYYQDFTDSPLSDDEFDSKVSFLSEVANDATFAHLFTDGSRGLALLDSTVALGTTTSAKSTVTHKNPMLSLAKAKTIDEIQSFIKKTRQAGASNYRLQPKLDGFALSARYLDGKLSSLATRGDGVKGEDISYLISSPEVTIVGLPVQLSGDISCEMRGEAYLTNEQFNALTSRDGGNSYKNPRNALVGLMRKAEKGVGHHFSMTFSAYTFLQEDVVGDLSNSANMGVLTVDNLIENTEIKLSDFSSDSELMDSINDFGKLRSTLGFPTDGAVIKPENEAEMLSVMGSSSHHPKSQIAFKYPAPSAISTIESIDVTVGKTGRITPVARITPTNLDGSLISNISLHNFNYVYTNNLRVGQTVEIHKANDIIPQVKSVIFTPADSSLMAVPTSCPVCSGKLEAAKEGFTPPRTLSCVNMNCESREFHTIRVAVSKNLLDIDGMSEKLLEDLVESGLVSDLADIFTLTLKDLTDANFGTTTDGGSIKLGESRAKNILNHIEEAKAAPCTKVIPALGITGLGRRMTKLIMGTFPTLEQLLDATVDELVRIDGVGEVRASTIVEGLKHKGSLIAKMQQNGVLFPSEEKETSGGNSLQGLSFSISGPVPASFVNRNAWVDFLESEGAVFHSSPKKDTSFMIGDANDSSSKIKKALSLGVEFMSPWDFEKKFTK